MAALRLPNSAVPAVRVVVCSSAMSFSSGGLPSEVPAVLASWLARAIMSTGAEMCAEGGARFSAEPTAASVTLEGYLRGNSLEA